MKIDIKKLESIINELIDDLDNERETSTVCILEFIDKSGEPAQIKLTSTNDEPQFISDTANGTYTCINTALV